MECGIQKSKSNNSFTVGLEMNPTVLQVNSFSRIGDESDNSSTVGLGDESDNYSTVGLGDESDNSSTVGLGDESDNSSTVGFRDESDRILQSVLQTLELDGCFYF